MKKKLPIRTRRWKPEDIPAVVECHKAAYPDYPPEKRKIAARPLRRPVRRIRVCATQYLMRPVQDWAEFERRVEFFVDAADSYHCHFLLFPEFFTAQLVKIIWVD